MDRGGFGQWQYPKDGGFSQLELRISGAIIVAEDEAIGDDVQKTGIFPGLNSRKDLLE